MNLTKVVASFSLLSLCGCGDFLGFQNRACKEHSAKYAEVIEQNQATFAKDAEPMCEWVKNKSESSIKAVESVLASWAETCEARVTVTLELAKTRARALEKLRNKATRVSDFRASVSAADTIGKGGAADVYNYLRPQVRALADANSAQRTAFYLSAQDCPKRRKAMELEITELKARVEFGNTVCEANDWLTKATATLKDDEKRTAASVGTIQQKAMAYSKDIPTLNWLRSNSALLAEAHKACVEAE